MKGESVILHTAICAGRRSTPSRTEDFFASKLRRANIKFERNRFVSSYEVDFLIDNYVVVEIQSYFHCIGAAPDRDAAKQRNLEQAGYTVLQFWCNEVRHMPNACVREVKAALQRHHKRCIAGRPPEALQPWHLKLAEYQERAGTDSKTVDL